MLYEVITLVSRTANTFQAPLISKIVETDVSKGIFTPRTDWFVMIIGASTLATIIGMIFIPSFQRLLTHAVQDFGIFKSVPRLIKKVFSLHTYQVITSDLVLPKKNNIKFNEIRQYVSLRYLVLNMLASSIMTIGVIAALYAGYLNPVFRTTASSLSSIINGLATIFMFIFIDPYLSVMVDDTT